MCYDIKPATPKEKQITTAYKVFKRNDKTHKPEYEYWKNNNKINPYLKAWNTAKNASLRPSCTSTYIPEIEQNGFCGFLHFENALNWAFGNHTLVAKIEIKEVTATANHSHKKDTIIFKKFRIIKFMDEE